MDRRVQRLAATTVAAGFALATVTTTTTTAAADPDTTELATPEMISAAARDLDVTAEEAVEIFTRDLNAMTVQAELDDFLGDAVASSWLGEDGELVVAVTDRAEAAEVRRAGATPQLVRHSEAELAEVVEVLNDADARDSSHVYGWYVDMQDNAVIVEAAEGATTQARRWLATTGADTARIDVRPSAAESPEVLDDLIGGLAYNMPGSGCSIGFSVQPRGFVTAGHCGTVGTRTTGHNGAAQGTFQRSVFPGADAAYVAVNQSWSPRALVSRYDGSYAAVNGSQVAPIGATTCRSGRTSGYRCGQIEAYNQTVNYAAGPVHGLTRTDACAQRGDSGGSFIAAGINAQGVTSGGSGFCGSGGYPQTYFQPVNPMLDAWNLTLVTQ